MLGARIAALRRDAGWSQAELAQRLKVSASAVGMYEQGRREPAADTLVALSDIFGVSTDYLLTGRLLDGGDRQAAGRVFQSALKTAGTALQRRPDQPLTQAELAALVAALLSEP